MRMAIASMRSWNSLAPSSPAPSSSMPPRKCATPSLPSGAWTLPPSKAKRMAISGTACSSTSQAVMPPGLLTTWIFMASALLTGNRSAVKARRAANTAALPQALDAFRRTSVMPSSSELVGGRLGGGALGLRRRRDQPAGHAMADVEVLGGDASDVLGRHPGDGRGPVVDLLDRQAEQHAFRIAAGERALAVRLIHELGDERLLRAPEPLCRDPRDAQLGHDAVGPGRHLRELHVPGRGH